MSRPLREATRPQGAARRAEQCEHGGGDGPHGEGVQARGAWRGDFRALAGGFARGADAAGSDGHGLRDGRIRQRSAAGRRRGRGGRRPAGGAGGRRGERAGRRGPRGQRDRPGFLAGGRQRGGPRLPRPGLRAAAPDPRRPGARPREGGPAPPDLAARRRDLPLGGDHGLRRRLGHPARPERARRARDQALHRAREEVLPRLLPPLRPVPPDDRAEAARGGAPGGALLASAGGERLQDARALLGPRPRAPGSSSRRRARATACSAATGSTSAWTRRSRPTRPSAT